MSKAKLRCQLSLGMFSCEAAVVIETHGRVYSLFAERDQVSFVGELSRERRVDGWLDVEIVSEKDGYLAVLLPSSTLEAGIYLSVRADQVSRVAA